jgi:sugar-specific transcriptional regulator TrmB
MAVQDVSLVIDQLRCRKFTTKEEIAARSGVPIERVEKILNRLSARGIVILRDNEVEVLF